MHNLFEVYKAFSKSHGVSYNVVTGEMNPKTGYMVGLHKYGKKTYVPRNEKEFRLTLFNYMTGEVDKQIADRPELFVGLWVFERVLHIDLCENIQDRHEAIEKGKQENQLAIWDCKEEVEIVTGHVKGLHSFFQ